MEVLWEILGGVAVGAAIGWGLGYVTFHLPNRTKLARTGDCFIALGVTFLAYGLSEALNIYGFLTVFVAALGIRAAGRNHDFHEKLHDFTEQTERMLIMVLLVLFGAMIVHGGLLASVDLSVVLFALLTIFLIRPGIGLLSLIGMRMSMAEKFAISFFGIRGMGSI